VNSLSPEIIDSLAEPASPQPCGPPQKPSKQAIRTSLKASTLDGVFAAIFSSTTSGILLVNFLLQVGASPAEIGLLSSIPMLLNLLQPVGAYFADRTSSRHLYCLWIFGTSRLLWLVLSLTIGWVSWFDTAPHKLLGWTMGIVLATNVLSSLGGASWVSWMAALVPHRLRGRYFGLRNSASSLTTLLSVPLLGFAVSIWPQGTVPGYGVILFLGVVAGIVSLGCQSFMTDVNPLLPQSVSQRKSTIIPSLDEENFHQPVQTSLLKDSNFLMFLLYFGLWTFAVNLSAPFFNLYMLDDMTLDLSWVTFYTSLVSGADLVMLLLWGRLADRLGNRPLLLSVGILVAVSPLFWLGVRTDQLSLWLWLPLIHLVNGGAGAAIGLCSNNIQMEVAPVELPTKYFAIAAAVAGISGGLGTTAGGFLVQLEYIDGLPELFALSAIVRLIALLPLVFVQEPRSQHLLQAIRSFLPFPPQSATAATRIADESE